MKNNKGITLLSLIIYMILSLMVMAMLMVITGNFKENFGELNVQSVHDVELDKIVLQMTKEMKDGSIVDKSQTTTDTLTFTNGNTYTYVAEEQAIYQNNNIEIAKNITSCNFVVTGNNVLKVYVEIEDKSRVMEFALTNNIDLLE